MYNQRKNTRLQGYDYSAPGAYHVTICTHEHACILGAIHESGSDTYSNAEPQRNRVELSEIGRIADRAIETASESFPAITVANYVIMPNHVHILLTIGKESEVNLSAFVAKFKGVVTSATRRYSPGITVWQRGFYDRVIRGEEDYLEVWEYIESNPGKWIEDKYYRGSLKE